MKIAYGKLGRSFPLSVDTCGEVGGDIEVVNLMNRLVSEGHEVHLVGRNRADISIPGVINHWAKGGIFSDCPVPTRNIDEPEYQAFLAFLKDRTTLLPQMDAWVLWLGQHGSSLHCVPAVQDGMKGQFTEPLISLINYGYPVVHMVNQLRVRPIWLCPDPRNMIKMRDLYDPNQRPVLAQYKDMKNNTFYNEEQDVLRKGYTDYVYAGIEMLATNIEECVQEQVLEPSFFATRRKFGMLVNEGPTTGKLNRSTLMSRWTAPLFFDGVFREGDVAGTWTDASQKKLGYSIKPTPNQGIRDWLAQYAATLTLPASSTGWATAKPWECFMSGTLCFKHPEYDDQRHIYSKEHMPEELRLFLSPHNSVDFKERFDSLTPDTWSHFAKLQLQYYKDSHARLSGGYAKIAEQISSF